MTVEGKASLQATSDSTGWFDSNAYYDDWNPEPPDIEPGDVVTVSAAGYIGSINPIGMFKGIANVETDVFTGTLHAPWLSYVPRVRCMIDDVMIDVLDVDPDGGQFVCDFQAEGVDLKTAQVISLLYLDPNGNRVTINYEIPYAYANMTYDIVSGSFGVGVHVDFVVGDSTGAIKGGGGGDTNSSGWLDWIWCGDLNSGCDMVPGDLVTITSDAGFYGVLELNPGRRAAGYRFGPDYWPDCWRVFIRDWRILGLEPRTTIRQREFLPD